MNSEPLLLPIGVLANTYQIMQFMLMHDDYFSEADFRLANFVCRELYNFNHDFWSVYPEFVPNEDGEILFSEE